jgi:arsenate reductase
MYYASYSPTAHDVLGLIRNSRERPVLVDWRQSPPDRATLVELVRRMAVPVYDLLCQQDPAYETLHLDDPHWTADQLVDLMLYCPMLIAGPIVATPLGVRLCQPAETVLNILPAPQMQPFRKHDGSPVIDDQGRRVDQDNLD